MTGRTMYDQGFGFPTIIGQDSGYGAPAMASEMADWGTSPVSVTDQVGTPSFQADGLRPDWMGAQNPMDPGWFGMNGFGMNAPTLAGGLNTLKTVGGLWGGLQALNLAKKQFNYQRKTTDANMANQLSSYNTALEDRARARAAYSGGGASEADAYIAAHKLTPRS